MTFLYENIGWIIKYGASKEKLYKWIVFIQYDADGVIGYKKAILKTSKCTGMSF